MNMLLSAMVFTTAPLFCLYFFSVLYNVLSLSLRIRILMKEFK